MSNNDNQKNDKQQSLKESYNQKSWGKMGIQQKKEALQHKKKNNYINKRMYIDGK